MRTGWRQASIGVFLVALAMAPAAALAVDWTVVPEQSRVLFDYQRNSQPAEGNFAVFEGEGVFDRDAPGDATLELRIDSASIDLDDSLASAFATSAESFDSKNFASTSADGWAKTKTLPPISPTIRG